MFKKIQTPVLFLVFNRLETSKKVFEIEKNKLITFASKNANIQDRLHQNKIWRYSMLFGLLFFIIGLSTMYHLGRTSKNVKYPFDMILISVSLMCVFLFIKLI